MKLKYTVEQDINNCGECDFFVDATGFAEEDYCDISNSSISFISIPKDCPMEVIDADGE